MSGLVSKNSNNFYTVNLRDENVHVQFLEPVNNIGGYGVLVRRGSEVYAYSGWSENGGIVDFIRNRTSYDYFWSNLDHNTNGYGSRYLDLSPIIERILKDRKEELSDEWEAREQYDEWKQHQEDGVTREKMFSLLDAAEVEELCLSELPYVELRSHRDLYDVVMDVCDFVLGDDDEKN